MGGVVATMMSTAASKKGWHYYCTGYKERFRYQEAAGLRAKNGGCTVGAASTAGHGERSGCMESTIPQIAEERYKRAQGRCPKLEHFMI